MAAIEKMCEFDGEFCGWEMYEWKKNNIQIQPKYRKLFRGAKVKLVVEINSVVYKNKYNSLTILDDWDFSEINKDYTLENLAMANFKTRFEYKFTLVVDDTSLQGQVEGQYTNFTCNLKDTIKKIKRLSRNYRLPIVYSLDKTTPEKYIKTQYGVNLKALKHEYLNFKG
jgi:hypothetical protein